MVGVLAILRAAIALNDPSVAVIDWRREIHQHALAGGLLNSQAPRGSRLHPRPELVVPRDSLNTGPNFRILLIKGRSWTKRLNSLHLGRTASPRRRWRFS